jgi:hypothetical protein
MIQPSEALSVWYFTSGPLEYIVAARGATDASQAFDRVSECRGQLPQRCPELDTNFSGRTLAIESPGTIFRRKVAAPPAHKPH